jgi:hypothetical protein
MKGYRRTERVRNLKPLRSPHSAIEGRTRSDPQAVRGFYPHERARQLSSLSSGAGRGRKCDSTVSRRCDTRREAAGRDGASPPTVA